jgi:hypothetical protein
MLDTTEKGQQTAYQQPNTSELDISLQKSSMFPAVKSCSGKTLIATSVPFHMPRKTSPKKPEKEKYRWSSNS